MKRFEEANEIVIAIIDETYGGDGKTYALDSQRYKEALTHEFGANFEESNVGPGFDVPAYVTTVRDDLLPMLPWLFAVFFSGKPLLDNVEAWRAIAAAVLRYFSRPVVLSRHGAACIAVMAVFDEMGGTPKALTLKSYRPCRAGDQEAINGPTGKDNVYDGPPILDLGVVKHLFEIEADGVCFLIRVDGRCCVTHA